MCQRNSAFVNQHEISETYSFQIYSHRYKSKVKRAVEEKNLVALEQKKRIRGRKKRSLKVKSKRKLAQGVSQSIMNIHRYTNQEIHVGKAIFTVSLNRFNVSGIKLHALRVLYNMGRKKAPYQFPADSLH